MMRRVRLRKIVDSDSDLLFRWINDHDLVVFNAPFRQIPRAEHDAWFHRVREAQNLVFFMIEDDESGKTIGSCQLFNIHPVHQSAELQIRIGCTEFQNRGVGREVVRQLVSYGFSHLRLHRIELRVFAYNHRAIRVYEKNGFFREGLHRQAACIDGIWVDVISMAKVRGLDE